jgi:hypothetical protein
MLRICKEMALEWGQDVTNHAARFSLPYQDPTFLPPFDVQDGETSKRYSEGKLHHLNRYTLNYHLKKYITCKDRF